MRPSCRLPILLATLASQACTDGLAPSQEGASSPGHSIQLAAATGGPGFYWLPPLVKDEGPFTGAFDGTRAPVVQVTCIAATGPACPVVVRYDATSPGASRVTVDLEGENYKSLWHTPGSLALGAGQYLLQVLEGSMVLGEAPLRVVTSQRQANGVPVGEIAVVRGKPLNIKFRIEAEAGGPTLEVVPGVAVMVPGEARVLTATQKDGAGQVIVGEPVAWSSSAPGVAAVSSTGLVTAVSEGTAAITASAGALSATAAISVVPLPPPAASSFGADGGTFAVAATGGGRLELTVPAAAVENPTPFGVRPVVRPDGAATSFAFSPSGRLFGKPLGFAYEPPAGAPVPPTLYLAWTGSVGRTLLRLTRDGTLNRWIGATRLVGDLPSGPAASSAAIRLASIQHAEGDGSGSETEVSAFSITWDEILAGGREALDAFLTAPSLVTADYLYRTIEVVATSPTDPQDPSEASAKVAFLEQWRDAVCTQGQQAVNRYQGLSVAGWDFPQFMDEASLLSAWAAGAEQTTLQQGLSLPFAGCTGGQPPFREALAAKAAEFLPLVAGLVNPAGRDLGVRFDEVIDIHLRRLIEFDAFAAFLGVSGAGAELRPIETSILGSLRTTAWRSCREQRNQARLARLLELELGGAEELSDFTAGDLAEDLSGCTTELEWRVRPQEDGGQLGTMENSGLLTPSGSGQPRPQGSLSLRANRSWILAGLVQAIQCPGDAGNGVPPSTNAERLVVSVRRGLVTVELASRSLPQFGAAEYLRSDSVVVTSAQIAAAVGEAEWNEVEVGVTREGNSCSGWFSTLPSPASLAGVTITQSRVAVAVAPVSATLAPGESAGFTATLTNSSEGVTWQWSGGTAVASGTSLTYTAGSTEGPFQVTATSVEDPTESASATVTIEGSCPSFAAPLGIAASVVACATLTVSPSEATVGRNATRQFAAYLDGALTSAVTWTTNRGSITGAGLYTAPLTDGPATVTATSVADPTLSATADVTVRPVGGLAVSPARAAVGFGRSTTFSVPSVFGTGPFTWSTDLGAGTITQSGVFTAGQVAGEFGVLVTSATGSAMATVIVDPWAGIYDGTLTRYGIASTRSWSVGRYSTTPAGGGCPQSSIPCYFTGSVSLVNGGTITACYFQPVNLGSSSIAGYCDYSASAFSLGLTGTISGSDLHFTAQSADETVLITFSMTKR